jgi:hypothetical protein
MNPSDPLSLNFLFFFFGWGVRDSRVLIVESLVDGVFCAGADLKERVTMTPSQVSEFLYNLRQAFRELEVRSGLAIQ